MARRKKTQKKNDDEHHHHKHHHRRGRVKPLGFALVVLFVLLVSAGGYLLYRFLAANWAEITGSESALARSAQQHFLSGQRIADLTFLVTTSPVPSNPDISMIRSVIDSAIAFHGMPESIVVAMDGARDDPKYDEYEKRLRSELPYVTRVERREERGYLTGNIENAVKAVKTRFVLVIQHDFAHTERVDLRPLMRAIDNPANDVQYIRFNKRGNWQRELWDHHPEQDMVETVVEDGLVLTSTPAWSDNNHLCRTRYYTDVVLPLTKKAGKRFPEEAMNPLNRESPGTYGTFLYGSKKQKPMIVHLDGKTFKA